MPQISRSALVPYSTEQMYLLVNNVLAYPEFLPNCVGSKIISQSEFEMIASIDIAKLGIHKTFSTHNHLIKNQQIMMKLAEGPFEKLEGGWLFSAIDNHSCKIEFNLEFQFANKFFELTFGGFFNELANNMIQSFTQRAKTIYGV